MYRIFAIIFVLVSSASVAPALAGEADYASISQLKAKGFMKCSGSQSTTTKFLYPKEDYAYINLWNALNPDTHMATTVTSKKYSDGAGVSLITTTPTQSGECDSSMVQIFSSTDTCSKLRETVFKEWKYFNVLGEASVYDDPTSDNVSVVLAPTDNGCLIVKYAALFFPAEKKTEAGIHVKK